MKIFNIGDEVIAIKRCGYDDRIQIGTKGIIFEISSGYKSQFHNKETPIYVDFYTGDNRHGAFAGTLENPKIEGVGLEYYIKKILIEEESLSKKGKI